MNWIVDRQVQSVHLGAAVRIFVTEQVVTALRVFRAIPDKALAGGLRNSGMHWVVDGQVQGDHTVAAGGGGVRPCVTAGGGVRLPVPHVAFAGRRRELRGLRTRYGLVFQETDLVLRVVHLARIAARSKCIVIDVVAVNADSLTRGRKGEEWGVTFVTSCVVIHNNDDIVRAVIAERRVKRNGGPSVVGEIDRIAENLVGGGDSNPIRIIREHALRGAHHINIQVTFTFDTIILVEINTHDIAGIAQFRRGVYLLSKGIFVVVVGRQVSVGGDS